MQTSDPKDLDRCLRYPLHLFEVVPRDYNIRNCENCACIGGDGRHQIPRSMVYIGHKGIQSGGYCQWSCIVGKDNCLSKQFNTGSTSYILHSGAVAAAASFWVSAYLMKYGMSKVALCNVRTYSGSPHMGTEAMVYPCDAFSFGVHDHTKKMRWRCALWSVRLWLCHLQSHSQLYHNDS